MENYIFVLYIFGLSIILIFLYYFSNSRLFIGYLIWCCAIACVIMGIERYLLFYEVYDLCMNNTIISPQVVDLPINTVLESELQFDFHRFRRSHINYYFQHNLIWFRPYHINYHSKVFCLYNNSEMWNSNYLMLQYFCLRPSYSVQWEFDYQREFLQYMSSVNFDDSSQAHMFFFNDKRYHFFFNASNINTFDYYHNLPPNFTDNVGYISNNIYRSSCYSYNWSRLDAQSILMHQGAWNLWDPADCVRLADSSYNSLFFKLDVFHNFLYPREIRTWTNLTAENFLSATHNQWVRPF